jgi:hypothetical protein
MASEVLSWKKTRPPKFCATRSTGEKRGEERREKVGIIEREHGK